MYDFHRLLWLAFGLLRRALLTVTSGKVTGGFRRSTSQSRRVFEGFDRGQLVGEVNSVTLIGGG